MGRALLIGYDPALAGALRASHHMRTHELETCGGTFEAARILRSRAIDLIITDASTSATDDIALVKELQQIRPGLKAIVLAPTLSSEEVISALRAQVFACFTRPVDYEELADMVRAAIEETDWHDAIQLTSGLPYWISLKVTCGLVTADRLTRFMTDTAPICRPSSATC